MLPESSDESVIVPIVSIPLPLVQKHYNTKEMNCNLPVAGKCLVDNVDNSVDSFIMIQKCVLFVLGCQPWKTAIIRSRGRGLFCG